jgi:predicted short-subunit dehydrogenase-like oxidoreductase (DUF2520 family)
MARAEAASLRQARGLAKEVAATAVVIGETKIHADLTWFCVSDTAIPEAAARLEGWADWRGKVALHSSGAFGSDALSALRKRGAKVASVHPMMTFVRGSRPSLCGVAFAIEGDRQAAEVARKVVSDLGGHPFAIKQSDKAAYHAWGMFASPLLTALLAAGERVAVSAGVQKKFVKSRALPILRQTLANYAGLSAAESFSGPIARGDVETVKKHLSVLQALPELREIYVALALSALRDLPVKNKLLMKKALAGR